MVLEIYRGKKVLVTGHTGFKGAWLALWLTELGADVIGFSLKKSDNEFVFNSTGLKDLVTDERGDITNFGEMKKVFDKHNPQIVFHLAAQPIVRLSYDFPIDTFNTNIMGTANVLECIHSSNSVKAAVFITTDKCYKNKDTNEPYKESDELGGHDPYSSSKACAEIVIDSYRKSFFSKGALIASARGGNVLGGGDFGADRLIPDCINSLKNGQNIPIRNPFAVRPWQHVLDLLHGYMKIGEKLLMEGSKYAVPWNIGPEKTSAIPVKELVELIVSNWGSGKWEDMHDPREKKHEAEFLMLDIQKAKSELGWKPIWDIKKTVKETVTWYKEVNQDKTSALNICKKQIKEFMSEITYAV